MARLQQLLSVPLLALAACGASPSEQEAREAAPRAAGDAPSNVAAPPEMIDTSSPEIANSAAESMLRSRADASGAPESRTPGRTKGPGAPDTSGRDHQERESER